MTIINLNKTEMGEECKKYLENLVGNEKRINGVIYSNPNSICVIDAESFYEISQKTKNYKLNDSRIELSFNLDIPSKKQEMSTSFKICLKRNQEFDIFLNKYRNQYKIRQE